MLQIPLFDAHCDTLSEMYDKKQGLARNTLHIALDRVKAYPHYAQFFAVFGDAGTEGMDLPARFRALTDVFYGEIEKNRDQIMACRSAADIDEARRQGKSAAILSVEGAELLSGVTLDEAYAKGVRMVTLTWNYRNALGGSCADGGDVGLTDAGRAFVRRAGELGVIVDVSHGSEKLFWDVARAVDGPFVASHSNSKALCAHRRNLTDDQFREIARHGGVAGINLYGQFLHDGGCATIDDAVAHIEHFLELGGERSVALGGDLDGCEELPAGIAGVQDVGRLAEALARRGYPQALLRGIFYENLYRVVKTVWRG